MVEEDQNIQSSKINSSILTNEFLINKKKLFWEEKFKIEYLITQLGVFRVWLNFLGFSCKENFSLNLIWVLIGKNWSLGVELQF